MQHVEGKEQGSGRIIIQGVITSGTSFKQLSLVRFRLTTTTRTTTTHRRRYHLHIHYYHIIIINEDDSNNSNNHNNIYDTQAFGFQNAWNTGLATASAAYVAIINDYTW